MAATMPCVNPAELLLAAGWLYISCIALFSKCICHVTQLKFQILDQLESDGRAGRTCARFSLYISIITCMYNAVERVPSKVCW